MDEELVRSVVARHGRDPTRRLDIARDVQAALRCVPPPAVTLVARELDVPRVEVEGLVSFHHFLTEAPTGRVVIRLSDDVPDRMAGYDGVREAFEAALGARLGETTADGAFTLERTACIGMSDQAPAALVNDVVVTELTPDRARQVVAELREHGDPRRLVKTTGDGNNVHPLVRAMVKNNVRRAGPLHASPLRRGVALEKALSISPMEVIREVKAARLRGRGGAGFPCGMKWEFARIADGTRRYVFGNADEGEPGTFKDRVLLTERPDRLFAGMTIAGYAIGAEEGILYLRGEYAYLRAYLEEILEERRSEGLLGKHVLGNTGFSFDIRIQMGAGAYVCGEETALITSAEGRRGDPKNRPPFPAQRGYLGYPTVVNNVETLCCVTKILHEGAGTFCRYGTRESTGTKLLSVSGDVASPGVYEMPFGIALREVLSAAGGADAAAVLVGGPSGRFVGPADFDRVISYEDLSTGGAVVVFGPDRDLLEIVHAYQEFFTAESCGYCTPCRAGNVLLGRGVERLLAGRGEPEDLDRFRDLGATMKATSRCGLGQTSANPVLTALAAFPDLFAGRVADDPRGRRRAFDLAAETAEAARIAGRTSERAT